MMKLWISFWLVNLSNLYCLLASFPLAAQVIPDATLPNNSLITNQGNNSLIEGGTTTGSNLFHSFEQFSIPTGSTAYFNNAADIQNIFSRVTGGSVSNINGLIRANGTANLFLLNPNGIIFGPNATLNIGGSFLASTANSLNFADGSQFSANAPQSAPLLTVSVPIGLQFGGDPKGISVKGAGQNLVDTQFSPITTDGSLTGLRIQSGKTLALVGGDVNLDGGQIFAPGGRIELGSIDTGLVTLKPNLSISGWILDYGNISSFKDTRLSRRALADASGVNGNAFIQIAGRLVSFTDGSAVLIQNREIQTAGSIAISASESLEVSGSSQNGEIVSGLFTQATGSEKGGNIDVSTKHLILQEGGGISARTFSAAPGGNLTINASDSVRLIGASPVNFNLFSNISAGTFSSGKAGDINLQTSHLNLVDGGVVGSATLGSGAGGNVKVDATNFVEISGFTPILLTQSALSSGAYQTGDAGSLTVNTRKLAVRDGGQVSTGTIASGNAGILKINATDSIEVSNDLSKTQGLVFSNIISAGWQQESLQQLFKSPLIVEGSSGNLTIDTKSLIVTDSGLISVSNQGKGNAGTLTINADFIRLNNQGGIAAASASGKGGEIRLQTQDLQLQNRSSITATAGLPLSQDKQSNKNSFDISGGNITISTGILNALENSKIDANAVVGNGGNINVNVGKSASWKDSSITANALQGNGGNLTIDINKLLSLQNSNFSANAAQGSGGNLTIDASVLAITKNSSISANAIQGNGGIIDINAQALFRSPDSSITANSQYGINGIVQIKNLVANPSNGLIGIPVQPFDASKLVASDCNGSGSSTAEGSSFVIAGNGGLPPKPGEPLRAEAVMFDVNRSKTIKGNHSASIADTAVTTHRSAQLVEAQGWRVNIQGQVVLTSEPNSDTVYSSNSSQATCYAP